MKRFVISVLACIFSASTLAFAYGGNNRSLISSQESARLSGSNMTRQPNNNSYAALGDSVAAGLGLQGSAGSCGRSSQAYPHQVALARGLPLRHLACSGATLNDVRSQLDQAYANGTPSLITITAGANDMQWVQFLRKCYATTCGSASDTALANSLRRNMINRYKTVLSDIQQRSQGNPPQVIVTGYYNPISNFCKGKQPYATNAEINWLNNQRDQLNAAIRTSIQGYRFVSYASSNFDQHGVCAKQPWSQGLNQPAPLHPTTEGQLQIARSVLSRTQ